VEQKELASELWEGERRARRQVSALQAKWIVLVVFGDDLDVVCVG